MKFIGPAKRLEDIDIARMALELGTGEDEIHAVLEVESVGSGFDVKGRPKMLFEPHVFYRTLGPGAKRDRAVSEKLAYAKWVPGSYPKDSYPRLEAAMKIDEAAALEAASWGLGQVLGENYKLAGYRSAKAMVTDFMLDEDNHLEAMVKFIKAKKLDDALRRHDWTSFARGYNGAGFAKHNYHGRLAAAYKKWRAIKDTPFDIRELAAEESAGAAQADMHGEEGIEIRVVQERLDDLGYHEVGEIDGKWGGRTAGAVAAFKNDWHLPGPAVIDRALLEALMIAEQDGWKRPIAPERRGATSDELAPKMPEIGSAKESERVGFWTSIAGLFTTVSTVVVNNLSGAVEWLRPLREFAVDVPTWVWIVGALAGCGLIYYASLKAGDAKNSATEAFQKGERV